MTSKYEESTPAIPISGIATALAVGLGLLAWGTVEGDAVLVTGGVALLGLGTLNAGRRAWSYLRVSHDTGWVAVRNWPLAEERIELAAVTSVTVSGTALVLANADGRVAIRSDAWSEDPGLLETLAVRLPDTVSVDAGGREVLGDLRGGEASPETAAEARRQRLRATLPWIALGIVVIVSLELWG